MITPTPSQLQIRDHTSRDLLVVAPAGCGKTEALALRVQGLLQHGEILAPQKILVVTFSNRARDNIRQRLRSYLGVAQLRDRVSVVNFHGLSARVFKAHANVIGLSPGLTIPESDWVSEECQRKNLSYSLATRVKDALRVAKQEARNDGEVDAYLVANHETDALEIERDRVQAERLTYDDLPRVAELILANEQVADFYRAHFGASVVDEFQDLTPQQLRIVNRIGHKRTTYAGDLAQGIYGFAGAKPHEVYTAISKECSAVVHFAESHRSSPAVLSAVNSMSTLTSGTALSAADPASWPNGGLFATKQFSTAEIEADKMTNAAISIAKRVPGQRIGIISRTVARRRFAETALTDKGAQYYRWDDGVLDTDTARIMRAMLSQFDLEGYQAADEKIEFLRHASGLETLPEPTSRQSLGDALGWCFELLRGGMSPKDIRARIRVGDESTLVSMPGIHLLTGHVGKGQQFDWVMILGAEDGTIPDFRARTSESQAEEARVLSVMISRARHGVFITRAREVLAGTGRRMEKDPSPFFAHLSAGNPLTGSDIKAWLDNADWARIATR